MTKRRMFIIFCIIGVINTLVDLVIYLILRREGLPIILANIMSTSVALTVSYILNKRFTFGAKGNSNRALIPFLIVTLTGLWIMQPIIIYTATALLNTPLCSNILSSVFSSPEGVKNLLAKLVVVPFTLTWNFVLYKKFVFKTTAL